MAPPRRMAFWVGAGFAATLAVAALVLVLKGTGETGVKLAVLMAARVAFLFFWPAYAGGAAARLFGPAVRGLARRGREFGLAFAAALAVHLALVAWLFRISATPPVGSAVIVVFGIGAVLAYALALVSIEPVGARLEPAAARRFRTVAVEYIAFLFLLDFVIFPLRDGVGHPLDYVPFALLLAIGIALRLGALVWPGVLRRAAGGVPR